MVASSAFVLTALTMTGLYMKGQEARQQDDGYTLDFSALENNTDTKLGNIGSEQAKNNNTSKSDSSFLDNDLDYTPIEDELSAQAGSSLVEIPGLTGAAENAPKSDPAADSDGQENGGQEEQSQEPAENLHYDEGQGLTKPVNGDVLLPYSMEGSIYFATLDQYKYNPATLFSAEEGSEVLACADGMVTKVFEDAELGRGITLELGNGYTVTYGQLKDICVEQGAYVQAGDTLGAVAAPSRYYIQEGTNLYLRMDKDGKPVNTENLF